MAACLYHNPCLYRLNYVRYGGLARKWMQASIAMLTRITFYWSSWPAWAQKCCQITAGGHVFVAGQLRPILIKQLSFVALWKRGMLINCWSIGANYHETTTIRGLPGLVWEILPKGMVKGVVWDLHAALPSWPPMKNQPVAKPFKESRCNNWERRCSF